MKSIKSKILTLLTLLLLTMQVNAQVCPLQEAVDFTATDCRGNEVHLFDILDSGQAVMIHFFIYHDLCAMLMPFMTNAYSIMGCNTQDVYFMGISYRDTDIDCQHWIDEQHVAYPTIGVEGGGGEITSRYGVQTSNVIILIMPDRSITIHGAQELYPFSTEDVVNALSHYGNLEPHPCTGSLTVVNDTVSVISDVSIIPGRLELINTTDEDIVINSFSTEPHFNLRCLYNNEDVTQSGVTIASGFNATFEVYASLSSKGIHEGIIHISTSVGDVQSVLVLHETLDMADEHETPLMVYPNPACDHVIIEGGHGSISIYNLMGQKIEDFYADGHQTRLSTANYADGIYFVKTANGSTKRLVIQKKQ